MKNLKIQMGQKVTWSEKLCQTCNIVSVTFQLPFGPHTFLYSNYDNRNTNIPYITLQILTYVMFLSVRHFEIFQPDRKAFFKNLPWKKKTSSETLLSFTWCGGGKYHHKKRFRPFFFLNIYP